MIWTILTISILFLKIYTRKIILEVNIPNYKEGLTFKDGIISDLIFLYFFPPYGFFFLHLQD